MAKPANPKRTPVNVAAIIPARAGQQSVQYKNLQKLGGKTLIQWAIEVAFAADTIDVVIVSTEDEKIASEAARRGALIAPRPAKYSKPTSGDGGFYHHAVTWMEEQFGWTPEYLVNLRPTGPLRRAADVDAAVRYLQESGADGLKSIIPAPLHPYKMWRLEGAGQIGSGGRLRPLSDFDTPHRRQRGPDQPRQLIRQRYPVFFQDAQIDITRRRFVLRPACLRYDNVWGENVHGFVLDERTSVDLDEPADFIRAEKIRRQLHRELKDKDQKSPKREHN